MSTTPPGSSIQRNVSTVRNLNSSGRSKYPAPARAEHAHAETAAFDPAILHRHLLTENQSATELAELENVTFKENLENLRALKDELNETDWMFSSDS